MTDRERMVDHIEAIASMDPLVSSPAEAAAAMQRRTVRITKLTADPAAGDATTNGVCNGTFSYSASVFRRSRLVAARVICATDTNVTEHASNFATVNVTKSNGAGGTHTVILSNTTKPTVNGGVGNIPKLSLATYLSLTSSIVTTNDTNICDAGSMLQLQIAKAASGVVVQPFVLELDFEEC